MKTKRPYYLLQIIIPLSLLIHFLPAQDSTAYQPDPKPVFNSEFIKQAITWNWQSRFIMADSLGSVWHWQVRDFFRSYLISPSSNSRQEKDEHTFGGTFSYTKGWLNPGLYVKSWYQSDQQTRVKNQYANHALGIRLNARYLQPYLGYQQSVNRSITDWGWDTGFRSALPRLALGSYHARLNLASDYDLYAKRQNYDNRLAASIQTRFSAYSGDSLSFDYTETSKQYYSGSAIEHVKIFNRTWQNRLFYFLSFKDKITLNTKVQSRDISYFNGRNILLLENNMQYRHTGTELQLLLGLRTGDETQDNAGIRTDSRARQTALRLAADYRLSERQQLGLDLAFAKLQYDTPDSIINNDDRDEQRFVLQANYRYRVSPLLTLSWRAYAFFFHQIYIFAEQSINNSWNRVYKLNPRVDFVNRNIRNSLSTQVLANYTVYDFETNAEQIRSYVFRKYTVSDSLSYRLFGEQYAGAHVRVELEDKGSFFQEDFSQQVLQSYRSEFYNIFLLNNHFLFFRVMAGYTYYRREEWRHIPKKRKSRSIVNRGPYINVRYQAKENIIFSANLSLSSLNDSNYNQTRYTTGYMKLYYTF